MLSENKNINTFLFHLDFAYKIKKTFYCLLFRVVKKKKKKKLSIQKKKKIEIVFLLPI
jgi:hypothetical protein